MGDQVRDCLLICCGLIEFCTRLQLQAITIEFDLILDLWPCMALVLALRLLALALALKLPALLTSLCCFYCLISFLQLAAFCQQFIKEMCYVMCYVMLCKNDKLRNLRVKKL